MTPEEARGYIDGLSFDSKQDVWGEFPNRYDHWDAFEAFATIAGLRYEYAVQVRDERWRTLGDAWTSEPEARARYSATPGKNTGRVRIVRRLVSDPEVVE